MSELLCILGMGRSGLAAARLALKQGKKVRVLESQEAGFEEQERHLRHMGAEVMLGEHAQGMLKDTSVLVVSPGIPTTQPIFEWAKHGGVTVLGEMEWAARQFRGKLLGVTGTNGKTTTTALLAWLLNESGLSARACGNIGIPLSQILLEEPLIEIAVAEISSFQLETIRTLRPAVTVFLNFTPDHLDRHGTLQAYWTAKTRIFQNQGPGDWALIPAELKDRLAPLLQSRGISWASFGWDRDADIPLVGQEISWRGKGTLCRMGDIPLLGDHNKANAAAAAGVASLCGLSGGQIASAMKRFKAVEHRLQLVGTLGGVQFYNDSKATNAEALAVALKAMDEKVVLIAGGRDKRQDFFSLKPLIQRKVSAIVLLGESAEKMARQWEGAATMHPVSGMQEAVQVAWELARPQGTVLLSPGCASFDMFRDYEERGEVFARCVQQWREVQAHALV
jgi:UDP-N-acetylmuramoylalanine--D-glutamate ligase